MVVESLFILVILFLGVPYRPIFFFSIYITLSASLSIGIYIYTGVAIRVIDRIWLVRVLLSIAVVKKIDV